MAKTDDWYLYFRQSRPTVFEGFELKSERILLEEYERALSAATGGPVTTTVAPYSGNPRDFYSREITLAACRGDQIRIELRIQQSAFALDDPAPILGDSISVVLRAPPASYAAKLATWHTLGDELAKIGCTDRTVEPAPDARPPVRSPAPLANEPAPVAVAKPVEPRVTFQGGVLEVAYGTVDPASLHELIESGEYRDATKVVLVGTPIGDDGVAFLARSGGFPSVSELHLGATGITDRGAGALAHEAVGLDHLERLDLGEVPAEGDRIGARDDSGVSDAGVEELARSARLPALRTIDRGKEYRFVPQGREGREVIEIRRADGSVVESVIYHLIWP